MEAAHLAHGRRRQFRADGWLTRIATQRDDGATADMGRGSATASQPARHHARMQPLSHPRTRARGTTAAAPPRPALSSSPVVDSPVCLEATQNHARTQTCPARRASQPQPQPPGAASPYRAHCHMGLHCRLRPKYTTHPLPFMPPDIHLLYLHTYMLHSPLIPTYFTAYTSLTAALLAPPLEEGVRCAPV